MRFKVGQKVRVTKVFSGGNFCEGDIVSIEQIGNEDEQDCYGAISPHDGFLWYLREEEVSLGTNADRIRAMSDEELANLLTDFANDAGWATETGRQICYERYQKWLQQLAED